MSQICEVETEDGDCIVQLIACIYGSVMTMPQRGASKHLMSGWQ